MHRCEFHKSAVFVERWDICLRTERTKSFGKRRPHFKIIRNYQSYSLSRRRWTLQRSFVWHRHRLDSTMWRYFRETVHDWIVYYCHYYKTEQLLLTDNQYQPDLIYPTEPPNVLNPMGKKSKIPNCSDIYHGHKTFKLHCDPVAKR